MRVVDDAVVNILREDQLSLGIVLGQLLKAFCVSVYLSCWMSLRLLGTLPGMIVSVLLIVGLVSGVIPLPGNAGEAWKILQAVLFVIGGSALLLSLFSLFAILVVPPVAFEKNQVVAGSSSIDVKEITRLQISKATMSKIVTIYYRHDAQITELPLYLVRNEATQQKLDALQDWCAAREISVEKT